MKRPQEHMIQHKTIEPTTNFKTNYSECNDATTHIKTQTWHRTNAEQYYREMCCFASGSVPDNGKTGALRPAEEIWWEAWGEWAPFRWRSGERSRHSCTFANDHGISLQLCNLHHNQQYHQSLAVSHWHFLTHGTGTFLATWMRNLCVRAAKSCFPCLPHHWLSQNILQTKIYN